MIAAVIPSRNGARWLDDALGSVRAQGELITEIVVVDDGSTDATTDVLAHHPDVISVRNEVPCGPAAARNIGVAATTAPLVTFLDVDDVWTPNALEQRLALLQEGPYDVVATRAFFRSMGKPVGTVPDTGSGFWGFSLGTALLTREAWHRVGPLEESLLRGEDTEWWIRARESGVRMARSDLVTLIVRTHSDSWASPIDVRVSAVFDVIRHRRAARGG